jgi:hypothetical protein
MIDVTIDVDELIDVIEELFDLSVARYDDDEHLLFYLSDDDPTESSVEFPEDLLSNDQQKELEAYLKQKGYE